jgi:hypothetical protein
MPPYCPSYTLTVEKEGPGSGTVTSSPSGIVCGAHCSAQYEKGTEVTLTAVAAPGSTFAGWSGGDCSGSGVCAQTIEGDATVTAVFEAIPSFTLTVKREGTGLGAVTSSPVGIACGSECSAEYEDGAEVTLTAVAAPGSTFTGWSGGGCSGTGDCVRTLDHDVTVKAVFEAVSPPPFGTLSIGPKASVKGGVAALEATCSDGPCEGVLELVAKGRKGKDVIVGDALFSLAEGASETIEAQLSRAARKVLRRRGTLRVKVTGTRVTTSTVKLKLAK